MKLIPFDRKLYEKGYKAIRRDGFEIIALFFNEKDKEGNEPIFQVYRITKFALSSATNNENGEWIKEKESCHDILLEQIT